MSKEIITSGSFINGEILRGDRAGIAVARGINGALINLGEVATSQDATIDWTTLRVNLQEEAALDTYYLFVAAVAEMGAKSHEVFLEEQREHRSDGR